MKLSRKISAFAKNTYMKGMNVKLKHLICLSIVTLVALQGLSATRLTASNLRRKSTQDKTSGVTVRSSRSSSAVKSTQIEVEASTAGDATAAKSVGGNSLLPEGFGSADMDSERPSAEAQKVLSAEGLAVKNDIKVEFGEGHGETTDEALKEAMKDVLQKVVGVYVDSDFRVNNDEIIQDEIITHSNGFIDHYKKMDEEDDKNGRGKVVTIKAWVKMRDFVNRMKKIAPSQKVKVDGLLLDNDLGNNLNAEALLRKEFKDFDPIMDLMEVGIANSIRPVIQSSQDGTVVLRYVYEVKYSKEKYYKKFLPRIVPLLDQIAERKLGTKTVPYKSEKVDVWPLSSSTPRDGEGWKNRKVPACVLSEIGYPSAWCDRKGCRTVSIGERVSKSGAVTARQWVLSEHLYNVYQEYRKQFLDPRRKVSCVLALLDGEGDVLSNAIDMIPAWKLVPSDSHDGHGSTAEPDFLALIGLLHYGEMDNVKKAGTEDRIPQSGHLDRYIGYIDITIDKGDVSKIKSAEIKLETKKESEQ